MKIIPFFMIFIFINGCVINESMTKERQNISIQKALLDIGIGINSLKKQLNEDKNVLGVYIDTIDVDLNLSGTENKDGKVTLSAEPISLKSLNKSLLSGDLSNGYAQSLSSGSTIKIKFLSVNGYNLKKAEIEKDYNIQTYKAQLEASQKDQKEKK